MSDAAVTIDEDGLVAVLDIPAGLQLDKERLRALIAESGISYGLDSAALLEAVEPAAEARSLVIARGEAACRDKPASIVLVKELDEHGGLLVRPDEYLGEVQSGVVGRPGLRVDGRPVDPAILVHPDGVGDGLRVDGHRVFASRCGALRQGEDGYWAVIEVDHGPCELRQINLTVSVDSMSATLQLEAGEYVSPEVLAAAVRKAGIVFGLRKEALEEVIDPVAYPRDILIAIGAPPQPGEDSHCEMLIEDRARFSVKADGSLDFRDAHRVKEVAAGQDVAVIRAATEGVPGMTIHGRRLNTRPGRHRPATELLGEGVVLADEETGVVRSGASGVFCRDERGRLQVVALYVVDGDLDLKVGNIETSYPVLVTGDVKEGFRLISSDDITVEGVIEDSLVQTDGNLLVGSGIVPGVQPIVAKGDVVAPYIRERQVRARSVHCPKSLRHCNVVAEQDVSAHELVGGSTLACRLLQVEQFGIADGSQSPKVQVGLDPRAREQEEAARQEQAELEEQLVPLQRELNDATYRVRSMQKKLQAGRPVDKSTLTALVARSGELKERLIQVQEAIDVAECLAREYEARSVAAARDAAVRIVGTGHSPLELTFGKWAHFKENQTVENVLFRLVKGEIVMLAGGPVDQVQWPGRD